MNSLNFFIMFLSLNIIASLGHTGHLSIAPTEHVATRAVLDTLSDAFAIQFDISAIPTEATIDLAELRITVSSDTSLGEKVNVLVYAAQSDWVASELPTFDRIDLSDTLFTNQFVTTGEGKWVEINVNHIVSLWHTGVLKNNGFYVKVLGDEKRQFTLERDGADWKAELSVYYSK